MQRLFFWEVYKYPSTYLQPASSAKLDLLSLSFIVASSFLQYLPIPPPKLFELSSIEGEDLDLHFHQSISPLSEGNPLDLDLGVPFVEFFFVLPLFSPHKH